MVMARIGGLFAGTTETSPFKIDCISSQMLYSKLLCVLLHDQYQQSMVKTLRSTGWKMLGKINCGRVYTVSYILCACCTSLLVLFLAFLLAKSSTASALVQLMFACVLFCTATISSTRVISASISHKQIVPTGKSSETMMRVRINAQGPPKTRALANLPPTRIIASYPSWSKILCEEPILERAFIDCKIDCGELTIPRRSPGLHFEQKTFQFQSTACLKEVSASDSSVGCIVHCIRVPAIGNVGARNREFQFVCRVDRRHFSPQASLTVLSPCNFQAGMMCKGIQLARALVHCIFLPASSSRRSDDRCTGRGSKVLQA